MILNIKDEVLNNLASKTELSYEIIDKVLTEYQNLFDLTKYPISKQTLIDYFESHPHIMRVPDRFGRMTFTIENINGKWDWLIPVDPDETYLSNGVEYDKYTTRNAIKTIASFTRVPEHFIIADIHGWLKNPLKFKSFFHPETAKRKNEPIN